MPNNAPPKRLLSAGNNPRLLFYLLLLGVVLLFFQDVIGGTIKRERVALGQVYESLAAQEEECAFRLNQLKIYETEETKLKRKLPSRIDGAARALAQTRETLYALEIAGEVKEKTRSDQSVVLETICEGTYADLTAMLDNLRESAHAVRVSRLTVEALGRGWLSFTAEIEYVLHPASQDSEHEEV